jgi:hypothetical protein
MTPDTADRINAELVKARLAGMGIGAQPDLELLRSCSLSDLLAARDVVSAANEAARSAGPPYTLTTVCDDRLIAAIYASLHYDPTEADAPDPILLLTEGGRTTALVHVLTPEDADVAADRN